VLEQVRSLLDELGNPAGATLLGSLLVIRLLDHDNQHLQRTCNACGMCCARPSSACQPAHRVSGPPERAHGADPREKDKLLLFTAALLAERRLAVA
jgi:hypothetical protein